MGRNDRGRQDLLTKVGKRALDELTTDAGTPIEWLGETFSSP